MAKEPEGINDANQLDKLNKLAPADQAAVLEWIKNFYANAARGSVSKQAMRKASKKLASFTPGYHASTLFPAKASRDDKYKWLVKTAADEFWLYGPGKKLISIASGLFKKSLRKYENT